MTTSNFKDVAAGVFYTCATVLLLLTAYIVFTGWQGIWAKGFEDFRSISKSIGSLEQTAMPVSVIAPDMLEQMHDLLIEIRQMNRSVASMDVAVQKLEFSVRGLSYTVPQGMREIPRQMTPWNMMNPFK